jgi:hypothetical protein
MMFFPADFTDLYADTRRFFVFFLIREHLRTNLRNLRERYAKNPTQNAH